MIDILHEILLLSNALQARGTGLFRAENLMKRFMKAFELLKGNMGRYEKEIEKELLLIHLKRSNLLKTTDLLAYLIKYY